MKSIGASSACKGYEVENITKEVNDSDGYASASYMIPQILVEVANITFDASSNASPATDMLKAAGVLVTDSKIVCSRGIS